MPVAKKFPHIKTAMTRHSQQPFIFHEFGEVWLRRNDPKCLKARHQSTTREQIIIKGNNILGPIVSILVVYLQHYANRVSKNLLSVFCYSSAARVNHKLGIIRSICSVLPFIIDVGFRGFFDILIHFQKQLFVCFENKEALPQFPYLTLLVH